MNAAVECERNTMLAACRGHRNAKLNFSRQVTPLGDLNSIEQNIDMGRRSRSENRRHHERYLQNRQTPRFVQNSKTRFPDPAILIDTGVLQRPICQVVWELC